MPATRKIVRTYGLVLCIFAFISFQQHTVPGVSAAGAGNLVRNPLFDETDGEGGMTGWNVRRGSATLATQPFRGNNAFVMLLSENERICSVAQSLDIGQAGEHEIEFWTRIVKTGRRVRMHVTATWRFRDEDGRVIWVERRRLGAPPLEAPEWTRINETVEVPEGARSMTLNLAGVLSEVDALDGGTATVFIDNVSFRSRADMDLTGEILPEGAELVLEEDFSGEPLPPGWEVEDRTWEVKDNALHGARYAKIYYTEKIGSPNMRIEYTAWSDDPGDLSAAVSVKEPARWGSVECYYFGVGASLNTRNVISRQHERNILAEQGGALEELEDGLTPGVKHRIVVQRNYNELRMFIDGKLVLEANDPFYSDMDGEMFGFILDNPGSITDVRVYALPWQVDKHVGEREVEFEFHEGFEGFSEGESCGGFSVEAGEPVLSITDRPTWVYKEPAGNRTVRDHCLEIDGTSSDAAIRISRSFDALSSGIVEFDVLAEKHGEVKFSVSDAAGNDIINLILDEEGRFMTEDRRCRRAIHDTIRYQRRRFVADFRLMKDRWYTFRLHFDGVHNHIVLLNHYSEIDHWYAAGSSGEYLPLDLAFSPVAEEAVSFSVSADGGARLYLDNLIVFGPVGTQAVRGEPITRPAPQLLGLDFPLRKDPFSLKTLSLRHITTARSISGVAPNRHTPLYLLGEDAPKYRHFKPAGDEYNRALVDLAFFEEKMNMVRRSASYVKAGRMRGRVDSEIERLERVKAEAELLQEQALRAYADAYMDEQNERKLDRFSDIMGEISSKHEAMEAGINRCLRILMPAAASREIAPHPAPLPDGDIEWSSERNRWERNGERVVFDYFSHIRMHPRFQDDFKLLGFPKYTDDAAYYFDQLRRDRVKEGEFLDYDFPAVDWLRDLHESNRAGIMRTITGIHYPIGPVPPPWWLAKYNAPPPGGDLPCDEHEYDYDIIFSKPDGSPPASAGWSNRYMFNHWNPDVREFYDAHFQALGRLAAEYRSAVNFFHLGWELTNRLPLGAAPGYNRSAVRAFRGRLEDKYRSIENLNSRWNADYGSFDGIKPPPPGDPMPSGLQYEFHRFVADGFRDWLRRNCEAFQQYAPDIPTAVDQQTTLGRPSYRKVDLARVYDIKLYHTYQNWDRKFVDRWHHQVARTALDKAWGTMEWSIGQGSPYMFKLEEIRNNGLREKAMQMMWGSDMMEFYGLGFGAWQYTPGIHEPRLDFLVFNYIAPCYAVYMERTRRLGRPALNYSSVKPEIGILESESSWANMGDMRRLAMRPLAEGLSEAGWDFEFLYEELLREGLQSLEGTRVLFVPAGVYMTEELADIVYGWARAGGVLFSTVGPPGVLNEYARPSGRLDGVFEGGWTDAGGRWELEGAVPFFEADGAKAWKTVYGQGKVIVFDRMSGDIFGVMETYADKRFGSDNHEIQFNMREKDGVKYLYALNWSVYEAQEFEIFIRGSYDSIVDAGLQLPMDVPHHEKDGRTYFRTKLAPAELTLFRIE